MSAKYYALLTNIGVAKITNAAALGIKLNITEMGVGDGSLPTPDPAQTKLVHEVRRAPINMLSIDPLNDSQIIVEQIIPENSGGWWIREVAIYDEDGDIIAVSNCAETYKPLLQEGSGRTQTVRMIIIVSNAASVSVKIDPAVVLATRAYVDSKTDAINKQQIAQNAIFTADLANLRENYYTPSGMDLTGETDMSDVIRGYLNKYKRVRLPNGIIKARLIVPSGCSLVGAGQQIFNRTTKAWSGPGTLIIGGIGFTGSRFASLSDVSIDAVASAGNGVDGMNDATEWITVERVTTRAINHGHLWEQNSPRADGRDGGHIRVTDCLHYGGPNGFVSKMRDVIFTRCYHFDTTVQGLVAVSDNYNGPAKYSRAVDTWFIDCGGEDGNEGARVYSRDHHSLDNSNNVLPSTGIRFIRCKHERFTGRQIRTGDFEASATNNKFSRVLNEDVIVDGGRYTDAPYSAIYFGHANRPRVIGSPLMTGNKTNIEYGDAVYDPYITTGISFGDMTRGAEKRTIISNENKGTLDLISKPEIVILRNTALTYIGAISGISNTDYYRVKFVIDDDFSIISLTGISYTGRGVTLDVFFDGNVWIDIGVSSNARTVQQRVLIKDNISFDFSTESKYFVQVTANIASFSAIFSKNGRTLNPGNEVVIHLVNNSANVYTLGSWESVFKWQEGKTAPTELAGYRKLILNMYWTGISLVEMNRSVYV
ncbi:hypothetical protein CRN79_25460 [Serratia fonticola]|nr:hypothetical protein CRN79_25460 [Serratia fonticola]